MKLIHRLSRAYFNRVFHLVVSREHEKGTINSHQMHAILGRWNRDVFPERNHANPDAPKSK